MKKFIYVLFVMTVAMLQACDNYVDIEPRGNAVPASLDDINLLLSATNTMNGRNSNLIASLVNDNIKASDQDLESALTDGFSSYIGRIFRLDPVFYLESQTDEGYKGDYATINRANYVIQLLENQFTEDTPERDQFYGEALVQSAYHYFNLVNTYGHHYGLAIASEAGSGVPIVTTWGDETVSIDRKSVNEVYTLILDDLNRALELLDTVRPNAARPNLAAAQALLARVHLHIGDYPTALAYATNALAFNSTLLDLNTLSGPLFFPPIQVDNPEHVFYKEGFLPSIFLPDFSRLNFTKFSDELVALYDPINDLRINRLTVQDFTDFSYVYGFWSAFSYRHVNGVDVPELMLIQAECMARLTSEDFNQAMDIVNTLRAARHDAALVSIGGHILTAADRNAAIAHVIDERRREFHVNGKRFFDIKRLNAIENAGISLTRGSVTYSANSINWAVPLGPNVIRNSNGQISQNPRE